MQSGLSDERVKEQPPEHFRELSSQNHSRFKVFPTRDALPAMTLAPTVAADIGKPNCHWSKPLRVIVNENDVVMSSTDEASPNRSTVAPISNGLLTIKGSNLCNDGLVSSEQNNTFVVSSPTSSVDSVIRFNLSTLIRSKNYLEIKGIVSPGAEFGLVRGCSSSPQLFIPAIISKTDIQSSNIQQAALSLKAIQPAASRSLHFIFPTFRSNSNSLIAALDLHYDPRNSKIGDTKKFVKNGFHQLIESAKLKRQVRLNNEKTYISSNFGSIFYYLGCQKFATIRLIRG